MIAAELKKLGSVKRGEWITLAVFSMTVLGWLTRPWLQQISISWDGNSYQPLAGLSDTGIVMTAAVVLFMIPVDWQTREFTMRWKEAERLPWGILILFGGGLSLANAVSVNGVAEFLGSFASTGISPLLLVLSVSTAIVFSHGAHLERGDDFLIGTCPRRDCDRHGSPSLLVDFSCDLDG